MRIKFQKIHKNAKLPLRAHAEDAGMDVFTVEQVTLKPFIPTYVHTGVAAAFDPGYVALVWDKSGIAMKRSVKTLAGVIDAGYRGEWIIGLINLSNVEQNFEVGDKIAQVLIQKVEYPEITEGDVTIDTTRGVKGFGSTGK